MKKQLTDNQHEDLALAARTVSNIDFLLGREEFQEFLHKFRRRSAELEDRILNEDMPAETRERLRQLRLGILEVILSPEEDKTANLRTLSQYGVTPGGIRSRLDD